MTRVYGCHNRPPLAAELQVQDGWTPNERRMVSIPFLMEPDCQYTHTELGRADARCAGCKHRAEAA